MKLRFSFILCGVLIFCMTVAASDESKSDESDSDEDFRECSGIYLKSKGKLDIEVPSGKKSSMCLFGMNFALRAMRDVFESRVKKDMPDKAECIMTEFDKADILDFVIQIGYIQANEQIPEDERKLSMGAMEGIGDEKLKTIATACGTDTDTLENVFETIFESAFDSSEEKGDSPAKTETA